MCLLKKCQLTQFLADDPTLLSRGDCADQARERKVADQDFKKAEIYGLLRITFF